MTAPNSFNFQPDSVQADAFFNANTAHIDTFAGLDKASVATWNGVTIATGLQTWNGLTT